jgi:chromosome segregation ATPase
MDLNSVANLLQQELARLEGLRQAALAIGQAGSLEAAVKDWTAKHVDLQAKVKAAQAALTDATAKAQAVEAQAAAHLNAAHITAAAHLAEAKTAAEAAVAEGKRQALDLTNQARADLNAKLLSRQKVLDSTNAQVVDAEAQLAKHQDDIKAAKAQLAARQAQLAAVKAAVSQVAGAAAAGLQSESALTS